ncbi:MAG: Xaa-Pro peptidase family protein [Candidatus Eiseniibacteriota bacterium]
MRHRLHKVARALARHDLDALLVTGATNQRYLTGFTSSNAYLIVTAAAESIYLTDARYIDAARSQVDTDRVDLIGGDPGRALRAAIRGRGVRRLCFEADHLSHARAVRLAGALGARRCRPVSGVVESVRAVKETGEIETIRRAVRLAERCFHHVRPLFRPGVRERDVALEIGAFHRQHGADDDAFEPIVAFGPDAAVPHHRPGARRLRSSDVVLVDWGARVDGYCSDLTRTLLPPGTPRRLRDAYDAVRAAQQAAIESIRPRVRSGSCDRRARSALAAAGYGEHFTHSLGHGIGLDVHERPWLTGTRRDALRPGMVVTVEPGVYLSGDFGIRIEDDVLVTPDGAEVLSRLPTRVATWG